MLVMFGPPYIGVRKLSHRSGVSSYGTGVITVVKSRVSGIQEVYGYVVSLCHGG